MHCHFADFASFFHAATRLAGDPYPYQVKLASEPVRGPIEASGLAAPPSPMQLTRSGSPRTHKHATQCRPMPGEHASAQPGAFEEGEESSYESTEIARIGSRSYSG